MGVTGTLETLSRPEKRVLEDEFNIKKHTYMPSVYGKYKLQFAGDTTKDVQIYEAHEFSTGLRTEIDDRQKSACTCKRAVLVFFESAQALTDFYTSPALRDKKEKVRTITNRVQHDEKEGLIRQAVAKGSITLLMREFGRGTDFICHDEEMDRAGGVHVIQTFVSDLLSEETQIKGRTARQSNQGSFSFVLTRNSLERYGISQSDIQEMNSTLKLHSRINDARNEYFERQYPREIQFVEEIKAGHRASLEFKQALLSQNARAVQKFLLDMNRARSSNEGEEARTVILIDATGSMGGVLQAVKHTVGRMFHNVHQVLETENFSGAFSMQLAFYRDYNDVDSLLEHSTWEASPESLEQYMVNVTASGGSWTTGNEAIEIGLWHVMRQHEEDPVSQVVLIADMPEHSAAETKSNRADRKGESYWAQTPYRTMVTFEQQLARIKEAEIPIHAFWVNNRAQSSFQRIARETNGKSGSLDINAASGAQQLTDIVCKRLLDNIGGEAHGARLLGRYEEMFGKGFKASQ
jgi:hypothetical protein